MGAFERQRYSSDHWLNVPSACPDYISALKLAAKVSERESLLQNDSRCTAHVSTGPDEHVPTVPA